MPKFTILSGADFLALPEPQWPVGVAKPVFTNTRGIAEEAAAAIYYELPYAWIEIGLSHMLYRFPRSSQVAATHILKRAGTPKDRIVTSPTEIGASRVPAGRAEAAMKSLLALPRQPIAYSRLAKRT